MLSNVDKGKMGKNCIVDLDMDFFKNSYPPIPTPGGVLLLFIFNYEP